MARFASQEKLGFYATPVSLYRRIFGFVFPFTQTNRGQCLLLDPCCGEGDALRHFRDYLVGDLNGNAGLEVVTHGIEMESKRASKSRQVLDKVLVGDAFGSTISHKVFSLLFLNPPYDYSGDSETVGKRLEVEFLKKFVYMLAPGGLLVFLIPWHVLGYKRTAEILTYRFENIRVFRFPDEESGFKQVVLYGTMKSVAERDVEAAEKLKFMGLSEYKIPVLPEEPEQVYHLPVLEPGPYIFRHNEPPIEEVEKEVREAGLLESVFRELYRSYSHRRPILPLRRGHLVSLLAAGGINGVVEKDGERYLIKGITTKETKKHETAEEVIVREKIKTRINILSSKGQYMEVE